MLKIINILIIYLLKRDPLNMGLQSSTHLILLYAGERFVRVWTKLYRFSA